MCSSNPSLKQLDYSRELFTDDMKAALDPSTCVMDLVAFQKSKCGKRLERYVQKKLCKNYGRMFFRCPDYLLPVDRVGDQVLPMHNDISIWPYGPNRCHFEWIDDVYPDKARDCINKLRKNLEKGENDNVNLKAELVKATKEVKQQPFFATARKCIRILNEKLVQAKAELELLRGLRK